MTIRDVEWTTGLERTNIRFYERAGLISPVKLENSYREYSKEDVDLLLKIKLMRRLGFSLDEIRSLKDGNTALEDAVKTRLEGIGLLRRELNAAEKVCYQLKYDKAEFSTFDAVRYLESFDAAVREPATVLRPVPESDKIPFVVCPWRRYLARMFDIFLMSCLVDIVLALVFGVYLPSVSGIIKWLLGILAWLILVVFEGIFLSKFETTPGKWLMDIKLEHTYGRNLTFGEAALRTFRVFIGGEGVTIPLVNIYRNLKCYNKHKRAEPMPWDEDVVITVEEHQWWKKLVYVGAYVVVTAILFCCALAPVSPKHRGPELTVEQFAENYNGMRKVWGQGGRKLQPDGSFEPYSKYITDGMYKEMPEFEYTVEDGIITKLTYREDTESLLTAAVDEEWKVVMQVSSMAIAWSNTKPLEALKAPDVWEEIVNSVAFKEEADWQMELFDILVTYKKTPANGVRNGNITNYYIHEFSIELLDK